MENSAKLRTYDGIAISQHDLFHSFSPYTFALIFTSNWKLNSWGRTGRMQDRRARIWLLACRTETTLCQKRWKPFSIFQHRIFSLRFYLLARLPDVRMRNNRKERREQKSITIRPCASISINSFNLNVLLTSSRVISDGVAVVNAYPHVRLEEWWMPTLRRRICFITDKILSNIQNEIVDNFRDKRTDVGGVDTERAPQAFLLQSLVLC